MALSEIIVLSKTNGFAQKKNVLHTANVLSSETNNSEQILLLSTDQIFLNNPNIIIHTRGDVSRSLSQHRKQKNLCANFTYEMATRDDGSLNRSNVHSKQKL